MEILLGLRHLTFVPSTPSPVQAQLVGGGAKNFWSSEPEQTSEK
jgi:hypothetical protein